MASSSKKRFFRVLHVDDDFSFLELSKQILEDMGNFVIDTACSVDEGLKKLETIKYDAVISDYEMPTKNGLQFLQEIRDQKNDIPFVLFTGKGREEVAIKALNLGSDRYVNKQCNPETAFGELSDALVKTIEHKESKRLHAESESKYRKLVENSLQGIAIIQGAIQKFVFVNEAMGELFGYTKEEMLNLSPEQIAISVHPDDRVSFFNRFRMRLEGKKVESRYVFRGFRKDGTMRYVEVCANLISYNEQPAVQAVFLDITESKKAEEILRESEHRYRELANSLPDIVFESDLLGKVEFVNERGMEIAGISQREVVKGLNILQFLIPEDRERAAKNMERLLRGGLYVPNEYTFLRKDGTFFPALITTTLRKSESKVTGFRGRVINISESKENQKSLLQSQEQFKQLFSSMPSGVAIYEAVDNGEDFVFRDFNATAERIEKINKDDVIGKRVTQVFPKVKSFGIFEVFQRVWRTGNSEYYPAAIYKDDKDIGSWRENWIYKLPNGNIIAIYNEISERVKTDSALKQERDRLESVTRSINAGLVIVSKDYHILWENDFIRQYKGAANGKLCFATLNELDAPCPDCGVAKIFAGETSFDSHEYCSTMQDGSKYWVEILSSPIKDENGEIVGASELAIDITNRKIAESALNQSMNELVLVNEKLNVVGRLTRHDVRNKLSAVNGFAYLLKKRHADQIDISNDVGKIERAVKEVEEIFEFAKNYEQLGIEELTYMDVEKTLHEAQCLLSGTLDLEVTNNCHGLTLLADSLLRLLFYNLIDNSVKHGEKITKIRVHFEKANENKLLVVYEDDGVGISIENKPFLFKEGFSTSNTSGYGLFLIQKMIEVYGWKIEENGVPNKGAKFTITIPQTNQNGKECYQITKY